MDLTRQINDVLMRPHIIIATPGRLSSILKGSIEVKKAFKNVKFLILDEADLLLRHDFKDDFEKANCTFLSYFY